MSWQFVRAVFELSASKGAARLVLLAIADRADKHGRGAFLTVAELSTATRADERTVRRALRDLEGLGELAIVGAARNGAHRFEIVLADTAPASALDAPRRPARMLKTCVKPAENSDPKGGVLPGGEGRYTRGRGALCPGEGGIMPPLTKQSGTVLERSGTEDQDPRPVGRALAALAFAVLKENVHRYTTDGIEFAETVKTRAARSGMVYDGTSIGKALRAAEARLKREAAA